MSADRVLQTACFVQISHPMRTQYGTRRTVMRVCESEVRAIGPVPKPGAARLRDADAKMANNKATSDDDLARAAGGGDTRAFAELLDRHGQRIAGLAHRMLAGQAMAGDVDDVVQETFLRLWVRIPQWQPRQLGESGTETGSLAPMGAKISTWLYRVAANLCIDRLRKKVHQPLDEVGEPLDDKPPADTLLDAASASKRIESALAGLAPRQRLAISLCHYQELSNIEAAAIMEISVEALESLLGRGRRALRAALEADRSWLLSVVTRAGVRRIEDE